MTIATPVRPEPGTAGAHPSPGPPRWYLRSVTFMVVAVVVTQRIGIPVGPVVTSVAVPLVYGFVALSFLRGMLVFSGLRSGLFAVAVSACLLTTAGVSLLGSGAQSSLSSLMLLITLYLPWVLRTRDPYGPAVLQRAGTTFIRTMVVLSVLGAAQLAGQLAGVWDWHDYLRDVVPSAYVVPGYNFDNELAYGVGVYKATAFVLLEPSLLSQFCALALLAGIVLRVPTWQLLVLAAGLASPVSGTGLVLLGIGGVLLLVRSPRHLRFSHVLVGIVIPVALLRSPIGEFLLSRQDEVTTPGSSGYSRFVAPYQAVWDALNDDPLRFLVGAGPGSVERTIPGARITVNGTDVLYSALPKLAFEYGVLAGGLFALFLLLALVDRSPWRVVPGALFVMVFFLSGALLQPQTAILAWLLTGLGAVDRPLRRGPARRSHAGGTPDPAAVDRVVAAGAGPAPTGSGR